MDKPPNGKRVRSPSGEASSARLKLRKTLPTYASNIPLSQAQADSQVSVYTTDSQHEGVSKGKFPSRQTHFTSEKPQPQPAQPDWGAQAQSGIVDHLCDDNSNLSVQEAMKCLTRTRPLRGLVSGRWSPCSRKVLEHLLLDLDLANKEIGKLLARKENSVLNCMYGHNLRRQDRLHYNAGRWYIELDKLIHEDRRKFGNTQTGPSRLMLPYANKTGLRTQQECEDRFASAQHLGDSWTAADDKILEGVQWSQFHEMWATLDIELQGRHSKDACEMRVLMLNMDWTAENQAYE